MLTAQASRKAVEKSGEEGATYYIRKDTLREEMIEIFKDVFSQIWKD